MTNFAVSYASAKALVNTAYAPDCTATELVGFCTLVKIQDGSMPYGAGCAADPTSSSCVQTADQDIIQAWITGGYQP
jgi:hypothetical protein